MLCSKVPRDFSLDIIELIKANASNDEIRHQWISAVESASPRDKATWVEYGFHLGALSLAPPESLDRILASSPADPNLLAWVFKARQSNYIEASEDRSVAVVDLVLDGDLRQARNVQSIIESLAQALSPGRYLVSDEYSRETPLSLTWDDRRRFGPIRLHSYREDSTVLAKCARLVHSAIEVSQKTMVEWATLIAPWDTVAETARAEWGDRWQLCVFANAAAGIRSKTETCSDFSNLFDHSASLCRRFRYARLRAGSVPWWNRTLAKATKREEQAIAALIAITWAAGSTIKELAPVLGRILDSLSNLEWERFVGAVRMSVGWGFVERRLGSAAMDLKSLKLMRLVTAIAMRAGGAYRRAIVAEILGNYSGNDKVILGFCVEALLEFSRDSMAAEHRGAF